METLVFSFQFILLFIISAFGHVDTALLDCSAFTPNSTNTSLAAFSWASRLSACFAANPYDTSQPPFVASQLPYLNVAYDFSVVYVISFHQGVIRLLGQLSMSWADAHRQWNVSQIPVRSVHVPLSEIWYPQVMFLSTIKKDSLKMLEEDDVAVILSNFTAVVVKDVLEGHCDEDYYHFPFDTQVCFLEFALDRYFIRELDVVLSRLIHTYKMENFTNEEWTLVSVAHSPVNISFFEKLVYPNGSSSKSVVREVSNVQTGFRVNITMRRHPAFYVVNMLIPIFMLSAVGQTAFALPEGADAKILVPLTVLLGFIFVQSIAAAEMPHSEYTPTIAIYITPSILLAGLSCISCALCMWLANLTHPLPASVKAVLVDGVGFVVFPCRWFGKRCTSAELRPRASDGSYAENYTSDGSTTNNSGRSGHEEIKRGTDAASASKNSESEKRHPWLPVAEMLNRVFGLGHLAAIFALFFIIIVPLFN